MKKLKFLLLACVILVAVKPAKSQVEFGKYDVQRSQKLVAADTINGAAELGKVYTVNQESDYGYLLLSKAHNVAHVGNVSFILYGSINNVDWVPIETITWKVTSADTAVVHNSTTTKVRWKFLKESIKGVSAGNRTTLTGHELRISK